MAVITTDHTVPHTSQLPATQGQTVQLAVRERDGTKQNGKRTAVLLLHGRSVPVLPGVDLGTGKYNWMLFLAKAGFDVFAMDLQGVGRSQRPAVMDQPCNVNPKHQPLLLEGHPLTATCPPVYASQLGDSRSDWSEVHTVVEFIKKRHDVAKVALAGWSAAAQVYGPYTIQHPENVLSLFLLAPVFPPNGPGPLPGTDWDPPGPLPVSTPAGTWGFPVNLVNREGFEKGWNSELGCPQQREAGMVQTVWDAFMDNDPLGRTWGKPVSGMAQGVLRFRNPFWWGWNNAGAKVGNVLGDEVPVLIAYGAHDTTVNSAPGTVPFLSVPDLYKAIPGSRKLMFKIACAGHQIPWERASAHVHHLSRKWLKHGAVDGHTQGSFVMDEDGDYAPAP
ncbi:alpha/beta fold hydrolase [Streptomyces sp. NPDC060048]|uniref:alpha/beta fold hydrolase n=1 Tax=unclassified Streptomyces TaxID=2593676 RepID=UPI00368E8902